MKLFGKESEHWESVFFCIIYESTDLVELYKECYLIIGREGLPLDKRVDTIVALNNPANHYNIMLNAIPGAELGRPATGSINLLPYPGSFLSVYPAKHSWALFIALLLQYMVQAPSQIINMLEYNESAPF